MYGSYRRILKDLDVYVQCLNMTIIPTAKELSVVVTHEKTFCKAYYICFNVLKTTILNSNIHCTDI